MTPDTVVRTLADARDRYPPDAMRWSLDHWDEAAPALLRLLHGVADGTDRQEGTANALFFVIHLMGEAKVAFKDHPDGAWRHAMVRGGIPMARDRDGARLHSLADMLARQNVEVHASGLILTTGEKTVCAWPDDATPLCLPAQRSFVLSVDHVAYMPDWIAQIGEKAMAVGQSDGAGSRIAAPPNAPAFRPSVVSSNAEQPSPAQAGGADVGQVAEGRGQAPNVD